MKLAEEKPTAFELLNFHSSEPHHSNPFTVNGKLLINHSQLNLSFAIQGETNQILWPQITQKNKRKDELWTNTCFEIFIKPDNSDQYWEFNFCHEHYFNCYHFSNYRHKLQTELLIDQVYSQFDSQNKNNVTLSFATELEKLTNNYSLSSVRIGISCIMKTMNSDLSKNENHYYALKHCANEPDFHNSDSYTISAKLNK